MASRNSDVTLIVRARDEAQKTIDNVTGALNKLLGVQQKVSGSAAGTGSNIAELGKVLATLDKAYSSISGSAANAATAFERQRSAISDQRAQLAAVQQQATAAAAALAKLNSADAIVDAGRNQAPRLAQLKLVSAEYERLQREASKLAGSIARQEDALGTSASSMQRVSSQANAVEDAVNRARIAIEQQTRALREQEAAAASVAAAQSRTAAAQQFYNNRFAPGLANKGANPLAEQLRAEEEAGQQAFLRNQTRQLQAEGEKAQAAKATAAELYLQAKAAEQAAKATRETQQNASQRYFNNKFAPGLTQPTPATQNGATFEALDRQMREAAESAQRLRDAISPQSRIIREANDQIRDALDLRRKEVITVEELRQRIQQVRTNRSDRLTGDETRRSQAAAEQELRQAQALRDAINPALAIRRQYNDQIREAIQLYRNERITVDELRKRIVQVREAAKQAQNSGANDKIGFLGLRPYELQNLSYQINDVFTQLASGTSLTQTLAQQGGQIFQLFQRQIAGAIGTLTSAPVLAFAASIGVLAVGISRLTSNLSQLRELNANLAGNADGSDYGAEQLQAAAKAMREYGISADDAMKIVRLAVQKGFSQDEILAFSKSAKGLAVLLGGSVADAAGTLATALRGGYSALLELNNRTNIFTADQMKLIRQLFEQGRASEATAAATEILNDRLGEVATTSESRAEKAFRELTVAWNGLLDAFSNLPVFTHIVQGLANVADAAASAARSIAGIENLQDMRSRLTSILDTNNGLVGGFKTLRERSVATANGYIPAAGYEDDSLTIMQLEAANKLLQEINAEEAKVVAAQKETAAAAEKQVSERTKSANLEVNAAKDALATSKKITSEARLRAALAAEERRLNIEASQRFPNADDATRGAYVREQLERTKETLTSQLESYIKSQNTPAMIARQFVAEREGFQERAYWDVNHWRVGFGSDTVTSADGSVSTTTKGSTVTLEGAIRDLDRRIAEFQNAIKATIGTERFNSFSPQQQAAITSVAYNYGKLPERIVEAVRSGTAAEIATAIEGLGGDNKGVNRGRRNMEAATFRTSNVALEQDTANLAEEQAAAQQKLSTEIESGNKKLEQRTRLLNEQAGLQGEALLRAQAQAAADEAELALREKLKATNEARLAQHKEALTLTEAEVAATRKAAAEAVLTTRALADARRSAAQQPVDDLTAQRDALQAQITFNSEQGNTQAVGVLQQQLDAVNLRLIDALTNLLNFWQGVAAGGSSAAAQFGMTAQAVQNVIDKLKLLQQQTKVAGDTSRQFLMTGRQINETFAGGVASAFDRFAQSVAEGKNVFKSLRDAFLQFASDFLRQIAQMIIKQAVFNAIGGTNGEGGVGGGIAGVLGGLFHSGGVVGEGGGLRVVNPNWYANARRYHTGGVAGLAPDEVPAVLRRGEEVLTADDPRHRANGGGAGGSPNIKIVNAIDAGDMVQQGLNTKAGEQAILNFMRNNPGAVRAAMG